MPRAGAALVPLGARSWLGQWDGSWLPAPAWLTPWGHPAPGKPTGAGVVLHSLCKKKTNTIT